MNDWMSADEAARRLGVKSTSLYSYVSRGTLTRRKSPDGRSTFNRAEIEELARRGRPRRQAGSTELVIESAITLLGEDRHSYRGRDAVGLAEDWTLEETAVWLWTGLRFDSIESLITINRLGSWDADPAALAAAEQAQQGLPAAVLPLERLQLIVTALAAVNPVRLNLETEAVIATGTALMAGMVDALPSRRQRRGGDPGLQQSESLHARLWRKLAGSKADERLADALRFAMVLLADHELAASTLAARVAASVRADPYAVVTAGLGVTSGALHGGASLGVESMLAEITEPDRAAHVIGERLRRGERISGFGHAVYHDGDGRADALLAKVRRAVRGHPRLAVADAVLEEAATHRLPAINVDFPLGLLTHLAGMPRGAGEAIFGIARTAGWLAHAMEEYQKPTRLRLRAAYTGPTE
ncbi:citrate synthase [Dactylosporangium sp. NPDC051541]|uniref:citrate synthase n=1 Tax=Dactylosporangium sp. NPDC051541 TaxID=3363977 RepID=UPI0037960070